MEQDFGHDDWRARFAAVEKVTMIARCLEPEVIRNNHIIQTALGKHLNYLVIVNVMYGASLNMSSAGQNVFVCIAQFPQY